MCCLGVFLQLDFDGDGTITQLEITTHKQFDHRGRSNRILDRVREFDETPIRYEQIVTLAEEEVRSQGGWRDAEKLFNLYDRNGDARVTRSDLESFVQASRQKAEAQQIVRRESTVDERRQAELLFEALRIAKIPGEPYLENGMSVESFSRKVRRLNTSLRMRYVTPLLQFDHDADATLSATEISDIKADFGVSSERNRYFPELLDGGFEELTFNQMNLLAEARAKESGRWVTHPEKLFSVLDADKNGNISAEELALAQQTLSELKKIVSGQASAQ